MKYLVVQKTALATYYLTTMKGFTTLRELAVRFDTRAAAIAEISAFRRALGHTPAVPLEVEEVLP